MSGPAANMMVTVVDQVVCLKITGRATFTSSVSFKTLVTELQKRGLRRFVIDLSECLLMDSTFLGVLAGIGVRLSKSAEGGSIELLNPNQRVSDLLDNLGVMDLFRVVRGSDPLKLEFEVVENAECSKQELSRNCLEAHRTLMELNPANVAKFQEVTKFLALDLAKFDAQPEPVK
jgi:anti-sigma B factor antagonist